MSHNGSSCNLLSRDCDTPSTPESTGETAEGEAPKLDIRHATAADDSFIDGIMGCPAV